MFYIVSDDNDKILGNSHEMPDVNKEADYYGCPVYVIQGERTGYTGIPKSIIRKDKIEGFER